MMREPLYDRAKGIGIILLVLGHLFTHYSVPFSLIFAFHMPLFFFISGLFLKREASYKKLFFAYFIPYFFFQVIVGGFLILPVSFLLHKSISETYFLMFKEMYLKIGSSTAMMESLWFLIVLSISLILCKFLLQLREKGVTIELSGGGKFYKQTIEVVSFSTLALLSIICSMLPIGFLPLRIASIPGVTLIIYMSSIYGKRIVDFSIKQNGISILLMSFLFLFVAYLNKTVNVSTPVYNDYFLYLLGAFLGVAITLWVSKKVSFSFLEFLGKNSLILFAVHGIWLRGYSLLLSFIMGEKFMFMENIPHLYCLPGCIFVLLMSVLTYYALKNIYRCFFDSLRKIIVF